MRSQSPSRRNFGTPSSPLINKASAQASALNERLLQAKRLLVVRLDNIGDVVMLSPALRALREDFPQAQITLLASPAGTLAAPLLPWVDDVITWRAVWQDISEPKDPNPAHEQELVELLRSRHFDAAFIFTSFSQSPYPPAYACYLAEIPLRLGHSKEFGGALLTLWNRPQEPLHQAERNLSLLEAAGLPILNRQLAVVIPEDVQARADSVLHSHGLNPNEPFVALVPGASAEARRYDPARFALAAHLLTKRSGLPVVILGSQKETPLLRPLLEAARGDQIISLVGETSVPEMAGVLKRAALVIANNSASMHLADALNVPMVILFSGTENLEQWLPRQAPLRLLQRQASCSPCFSFRCPYHKECLDIPAEEVVEAAVELLSMPLQPVGCRDIQTAPILTEG